MSPKRGGQTVKISKLKNVTVQVFFGRAYRPSNMRILGFRSFILCFDIILYLNNLYILNSNSNSD